MPTVKMVEYDDASPEVRAIYDEIKSVRKMTEVSTFYKVLATNPAGLSRYWESLKVAMAPGRLDLLTKELIAIAVGIVEGCDYCVDSHVAIARRLGMDDEILGELVSVISVFSEAARISTAYQLKLEENFDGLLSSTAGSS